MRRGHFVFDRGLDDRDTWKLRCSINKVFLLCIAWTSRVDNDILGVAGCPAKQVEDSDSVIRIRFAERIAVNIDLGDIRYDGKPCKFGRISQVVISKVDSFHGKQTLNTGQGRQTI